MKLYANVILPLKFRDTVTYSIPQELSGQVVKGSVVSVKLVGRAYYAVVESITSIPNYDPKRIKKIESLENTNPITEDEIVFWKQLADYYMCSLGEVMFASISMKIRGDKNSPSKKGEEYVADDICTDKLPILTEVQADAKNMIVNIFKSTPSKVVLLNGVTGSGKTEIYIQLISEALSQGKNVLYLLPEVAVSRQLSKRMEKVFGNRVLTYHSKQTQSKKRLILEVMQSLKGYLVLGLRSALFLPLNDLDLIIVDEEHDTSYKQTSPAPRYNGRDAAILLSKIKGAKVLLGSATPSLETVLNVQIGKYSEIRLNEKYSKLPEPTVEVVDMLKERQKRAVKGVLSKIAFKEMQIRLDRGEQIMVFRSRRSYSPAVQCRTCGEVLKCSYCNVPFSYHKYKNTLDCHYCGQSKYFSHICPNCATKTVELIGSGTEKIEEELVALFPDKVVARFDADIVKSKKEEERIVKGFAKKEIDILVGTQMISKGFDFKNLTLVVVITGESILSLNNFRADEYALQLMTQLKGRAGRHLQNGMMLIQTTQPEHPVYTILVARDASFTNVLQERKEFSYPPYYRLINIIVKDKYKDRLEKRAEIIRNIIRQSKIDDFTGPFPPPLDQIQGEYALHFVIRLEKNNNLQILKRKLYSNIVNSGENVIIDVDPV